VLYEISVSVFQHPFMRSSKKSVVNKVCGAHGRFQTKFKSPSPKMWSWKYFSLHSSLKSWLFYFTRILNLYVPLRIQNPQNSTGHTVGFSWLSL